MHERKDDESIIKEKAFRKLGEAPEGTQCIDFPKPHNHGVKVKYIYKKIIERTFGKVNASYCRLFAKYPKKIRGGNTPVKHLIKILR